MRDDNKDEMTRRLNDHSERIEQLTERVDALFAKPLTYQRLPSSLESSNDWRHRGFPKVSFSNVMHKSIFQDRDLIKILRTNYKNMIENTIEEPSSRSTNGGYL